jgi:hypothetical protein
LRHESGFRPGLCEALDGIVVDPDELAYFALTSKPEAQIRDRLAYRLHKMLTDDDVVVAREWKRTDLALLRRGTPACLIEAKALLSADLTYEIRVANWQRRISADMVKAMACAKEADAPEAEIYALVIATHVLTPVPRAHWAFIKYGVRLASVTPKENVEPRLRDLFPGAGSPHQHSFGPGEAFGISVEVTTWLFGPWNPG